MPVTVNDPAPYAPAAAILEVINRHRSRGLPLVDAEALARGSIVSDSLIPRTLQALKTLDLIDDEGRPTDGFERLRLAPEAEFQARLGQWLNDVYADVVKHIDPGTADEVALRDAFRAYKPIGQQPRMISLFVGLYAAAGIGSEKDKGPRAVRRRRPSSAASVSGGGPRRSPAASATAAPMTGALEQAGASQALPAASSAAEALTSDRSLQYRLVNLLENDDLAEDQRQAVWTLLQYLAGRVRQTSQSAVTTA